jgi:Cu-processing system permease protein
MRLEHLTTLGVATFREAIRNRILYSIGFFVIATVALSTWLGSVTVGGQVKVVKHFGLTNVSLATVIYSIIAGATFLAKELSRKTIYNLLSKPLSRLDFLLGKFLGLTSTGCTLVLMMGTLIFFYSWVVEGAFDFNLLQPLYFMCLEVAIVCAAIIFFSSIVVTPVLSGLFTAGFFIAGRCSDYILSFVELSQAKAALLAYWFLPHLSLLFTADDAVAGNLRTSSEMVLATLYAFTYSLLLLALASIPFSRRHFN